jgi:hypothetical protein
MGSSQDTCRMEYGTLSSPMTASTMPLVLEKGAKQAHRAQRIGMQCVQENGQGGTTGFAPRPAAPGRFLNPIKKFTVDWSLLATASTFLPGTV